MYYTHRHPPYIDTHITDITPSHITYTDTHLTHIPLKTSPSAPGWLMSALPPPPGPQGKQPRLCLCWPRPWWAGWRSWVNSCSSLGSFPVPSSHRLRQSRLPNSHHGNGSLSPSSPVPGASSSECRPLSSAQLCRGLWVCLAGLFQGLKF